HIMIDEELLYRFGAETKNFKKNEIIFKEKCIPFYYFQIKKGTVKYNNFKEDGKEFIQNIFYEGDSFGESLLFLDVSYPVNAVATDDTVIFQLPKKSFFELLKKNPLVAIELNKALSAR